KGAAAGQNADAGKAKGLGTFVQQKLNEGKKGKELSDAIHEEQVRLGIKEDASSKNKIQDLQQKQDKIAKFDKKIADTQERLNKAGDDKKKEKIQKDIGELNAKKEKIQKEQSD